MSPRPCTVCMGLALCTTNHPAPQPTRPHPHIGSTEAAAGARLRARFPYRQLPQRYSVTRAQTFLHRYLPPAPFLGRVPSQSLMVAQADLCDDPAGAISTFLGVQIGPIKRSSWCLTPPDHEGEVMGVDVEMTPECPKAVPSVQTIANGLTDEKVYASGLHRTFARILPIA